MKKIILLTTLSLASFSALATQPEINWTGIYAGINAGYGWGEEQLNNAQFYHGGVLAHSFTGAQIVTNSQPVFNSAFSGAQLGYNYAINNMGLVGLEAEIDGGSFGANYYSSDPQSFTAWSNMNWLGTIKAKAGFIAANALFYVNGGFAVGRETLNISDNVNTVVINSHDTQYNTGWVAGAGIEYPICPSLSIKAEYQYLRFNSNDFTLHEAQIAPGAYSTIDINGTNYINMARLGLNYHF